MRKTAGERNTYSFALCQSKEICKKGACCLLSGVQAANKVRHSLPVDARVRLPPKTLP